MVGVLTLHRTTIGRKIIMALTGLIGLGFVVFHMYGHLKAFVGPTYYNAYADGLRTLGAPIFGYTHLIWIGRLVLLLAVVLHVWAAWSLAQDSHQARTVRYSKYQTLQATAASRYMRVGGVVLLVFLLFHLMHLTWGVPGIHPNFSRHDVYHNLVVGLQSYAYLPALFYVIVMPVLGLHLYHGVWSLFQTLGLNNRETTPVLRLVSLFFALIVSGGFVIIPLAVIFGIITK